MPRKPGVLCFVVLALSAGTVQAQTYTFGGTLAPALSIPPSGTGGDCSDPANVRVITIDVPLIGNNTGTDIVLGLIHPNAADISISLEHAGYTWGVAAGAGNNIQLAGLYTFDFGLHPNFFIASGNAPAGSTLPPGTYQLPDISGLPMCGPWTIKICDDSAGSIGNVDYAAIVLSTNTVSYTSNPPSALAIPPTGTGGACTGTGASANTLTWSMTVPGGGTIADVDAIVNLSHARYGDVVMTLSHAGVTAVLLDGLVVSVTGINSDLCGSYTLDDEAPTAIDAAAIAAGGGTNCIPTGASNPYSPDGLLSVFDGIDRGGVWTLTVCDDQSLNSGTFFGLTLKFSPNCAYALSVFQPAGNPASSLTFKMTCGYPFHTYVNAISLTPGSTPNGWFYGLDIPVADLIAEISFGPPFIGSLDSCGNATVVVPGPIIPGLQLTLVGLAFSPTTSALSAHTNAFFYTTL